MRIGDRVRRKVGFVDYQNGMTTLHPVECDCDVEYIHPERRFYTLRVLLPSGESFRTTDYFYPRSAEKI